MEAMVKGRSSTIVEIGMAFDRGDHEAMLKAAVLVAAGCRQLEARGAECIVALEVREAPDLAAPAGRWGFYAAYQPKDDDTTLMVNEAVLRETIGAVRYLPDSGVEQLGSSLGS